MTNIHPYGTVYEIYKNALSNNFSIITLFSLSRIHYSVKRGSSINKYRFVITRCLDYPRYRKIYKLLYKI